MARKKKVIPNIQIVDFGDKGKGIGKDANGKVYLVEDVVPGDEVDVLVLRKKKGLPYGFPTAYNKYSDKRVSAPCAHFGVCGGCSWMNIDTSSQLAFKEKWVRDKMDRIAKVEFKEYLPILAAPSTTYYRNKLEFTFSNKRWLTQEEVDSEEEIDTRDALGFHRPGAFDKIVDIEHCHLQGGISNEVRNSLRDFAKENTLSFYNVRAHEGLLRNLIVRSTLDGQVMLIVCFGENDPEGVEAVMSFLKETFAEKITSLNYVINLKKNDTIYDQEVICFAGQDFITEKLNEVKFRIGPKSFFQTNPEQTSYLYQQVLDFAELKERDIVYDLYTGLGSIALFLAHKVQSVIGIEEVAEAIDYARINAELNQIENAHFYAGDVKELLTKTLVEKHGKPHVLITDPPRVGMHEKVVNTLRELKIPKIVYVSCNAATQARDFTLLKDLYTFEKIRAVDMFPHTNHVESVALLKLKNE